MEEQRDVLEALPALQDLQQLRSSTIETLPTFEKRRLHVPCLAEVIPNVDVEVQRSKVLDGSEYASDVQLRIQSVSTRQHRT